MVLGTGDRAKQIDSLRPGADHAGMIIIGYVDLGCDEQRISSGRIFTLGDDSLRSLAEQLEVDEIVVAADDRRNGLPVDEILECKMHGIHIMEAASFYERQLGKIRLDALHPSNVIFADGFTQAVSKITEKRILDIVVSTVMIVLTLPLMVLTVVAAVSMRCFCLPCRRHTLILHTCRPGRTIRSSTGYTRARISWERVTGCQLSDNA